MNRSSAPAPDFANWTHRTVERDPSAVALLIHGLNLLPSRMDEIGALLAGLNVECLRVSLQGHRDPLEPEAEDGTAEGRRLEAFRSVTREIWMREAREAYEIARARSEQCRIPLILAGYSLGAVIGCNLMADPSVSINGLILFAPAFRVRWYTRLLRLLKPFPRLALPSFSPAGYAANSSTPLAAYTALFEAIDSIPGILDVGRELESLIFVDPKDELVSFEGLRSLCQEVNSPRWELIPIERRLSSERRDFHHLVIDPASVGDEVWGVVRRRIERFVENLRLR